MLKHLYNFLFRVVDRIVILFCSKSHPEVATKIHFRRALGRKLNLKNPQSLNEKMQWLKLNEYSNNELVKQCADKYRVREYVENKGCSEILNGLIGVWNTVDDINWDELPRKFVIKCNHGSGYNLICKDKELLDINKAKKTIQSWMDEDYGDKDIELIYDGIEKKIICEEYIDAENGIAPTDIKIFCSYGEPKFIYTMIGNDEYQDYFLLPWTHLPLKCGNRPNSKIEPQAPINLGKILAYAKVLSSDFPIVRVDFYNEKNKIVFGEITFLTTGGMTPYNPDDFDYTLGQLFPITDEIEKMNIKKRNKNSSRQA